ncbi:MAG: FAD-dependent oxidoreductase [Armatimonadota bacterium]
MTEHNLSTEHYDLIVCGAGVAGVAAALEAARAGLSVALVEKTILPGGLATSGLVYVYLPLCDGHGTQVTYGIAEELLQLSIKYGPGKIPPNWREQRGLPENDRYRVTFSPASFVLALDEVLEQAGVRLWLDTLACAPTMQDDRVVGVEVETKAGRQALTAPVTIDATGDGDIAARAGAACVSGNNIMSLWALQASLANAQNAVARGDGTPLLSMYAFGGDESDPEVASGERCWQGATAEEITAFTLAGRKVLREHFQAVQAETGRQNAFPLAVPTMAQYRMTRRIVGKATLQPGQAWQPQPGAVGLIADWRVKGSVWEIPYGTLLPEKVNGLLTAGRCISVAGDAWHVTRVIPAAALTGQIAGLAARLAIAAGHNDPAALDVVQVQRALRAKSIPCEIREVYSAPGVPHITIGGDEA